MYHATITGITTNFKVHLINYICVIIYLYISSINCIFCMYIFATKKNNVLLVCIAKYMYIHVHVHHVHAVTCTPLKKCASMQNSKFPKNANVSGSK